jgi:hypothetical protein
MEYKNERKAWFLRGPYTQYKETIKEIKAMARKADVRIIDERFASKGMIKALSCENPPKVTKKPIKVVTNVKLDKANAEIEELKAKLAEATKK